MQLSDYYHTIEKPSAAEFKDRGSRFIAYAFPMATADDFKKKLKELKEEHPKAAHYCFAYRIGWTGDNFRASDDGEPSGAAGKPMLAQLDSKDITNAAVIVVRYFGGTLLGVPGLINAYKTVTSLALQLTPVLQKPIMQPLTISFDYTRQNEVMRIAKLYKCIVLEQEQQLFCKVVLGVPKENTDIVVQMLSGIRNLDILA